MFSTQLCFFLLSPIVILEELGQLIPQHGDVGQGPYKGQLAVQVYHGLLQCWEDHTNPLALTTHLPSPRTTWS
jgi:hypothetical protein